MKKLYSLLSFLLLATGLFAQTSFPVEVTNEFDPIPAWAYNSGQKNNAYTIQLVTRAQVEAAPNTSIGHLYALTGNFAPQPGKATVIRGFYVKSTKPITMQIRVGTPTGALAVANIPEMDLGLQVDSNLQYISCDWVIRNIKSVFIYCLNFMRAADNDTWITITPVCYNITDDFNWNAKKRWGWVGTSITNGSGPDNTGTMYHTIFKDTVRYLGGNVRHELNGISGSTTAIHYPLFKQGVYDHLSDGKVPDVLIIELGVNDATVATPSGTYIARLNEFARRFLTNPENKKVIVLILGSTPLENTTASNNAVTLDAVASALATTLNAAYPNRCFFVPLSGSFDRLVAANYATSDTPGQRIHPSSAGCQLIINNGFAPWLATANGQIFLNAMKN